MSKQKIILDDLFGDVTSCYIRAHPSESTVFAATGDDQLNLCRFDWEKDEAKVYEKTGLPETIGCLSFNTDGSRINCACRSTFYSMDSEHLGEHIDKRVFSDPIVSVAPFSLSNQSYNFILGDEEGNLHLIDSREATTVKDRLFKSRTEGVSISSMVVQDKLVYIACENGVVEVFDLKKRGFLQDGIEFDDKMLTHIFMDDGTPVVSTDEGEVLWVDLEKQRTLFKAKHPDLLIDRVVPISDEFALVKSMAGDNLMLLSTVEHKFVGMASTEPAADLDSTYDNEQIVVALEHNGHINVQVWDTKLFVNPTSHHHHRTPNNGNADGSFFADLDEDDDMEDDL